MNRLASFLVATGVVVGVNTTTATTATAATIDCHSARRDPSVSFKQYAAACFPSAARLGAAAASATVYDVRVSPANANFSGLPTWSDADIKAQFEGTRDKQFMRDANSTLNRRISWLYPDDGCFARAEQVIDIAADAGKAKPYKIFSFGNLRVYTANSPDQVVYWGWHVVPILKNAAGQVIVLDAALDPCHPLTWTEWLAKQVDDVSEFDLPDNGVSIVGPNAYFPQSLAAGEPNHRADSLSDEQNTYLPREWTRQGELGFSPNTTLGVIPPWGIGVCLRSLASAPISVPANGSTTTTLNCAKGTELAVGGGFNGNFNSSLTVTKSVLAKSTDSQGKNTFGWSITASNGTSQSQAFYATAQCVYGYPTDTSITTVSGSAATMHGGKYVSTTAKCTQAGASTIAGGWSTGAGVRVFNSGKIDTTRNPPVVVPSSTTWTISANNSSSTDKTVTAYAYCMNHSSVVQKNALIYDDGDGEIFCDYPGLALGGGFMTAQTGSRYVEYMGSSAANAYFFFLGPGTDANPQELTQCWTGIK